jgi:hypothetical protein
VRKAGSYESIGLAIEAATAELGYVIAIEGLLGPELELGVVIIAYPLVRPIRRHFVLQHETSLARDPVLQDFAHWVCEQAEASMQPPRYQYGDPLLRSIGNAVRTCRRT